MDQTDFTALSDEELQAEAKKLRPSVITNALFIGFLIGIVLFSIINSSFGLLMLIPLYMIYRLVTNSGSRRLQAIEAVLKQRKLQ